MLCCMVCQRLSNAIHCYNVWRTWDLFLYPLARPLARGLAGKSDVVKATQGIAFVLLDTTLGVYHLASIIDRVVPVPWEY